MRGTARLGLAWRSRSGLAVEVWPGRVRLGTAGQGGQGWARFGGAWNGLASRVRVWRG
ncbi:hypothetical protein LCGC14_2626780, partial [marine sediment metagenome]